MRERCDPRWSVRVQRRTVHPTIAASGPRRPEFRQGTPHGPERGRGRHDARATGARCRDPARSETSGYIRPMAVEQIKERLHTALHRGGRKASEEELEAVTEVVLLVVAEVTAEMAILIADLEERVEALEAG